MPKPEFSVSFFSIEYFKMIKRKSQLKKVLLVAPRNVRATATQVGCGVAAAPTRSYKNDAKAVCPSLQRRCAAPITAPKWPLWR
jgi:hypothetical protein